MHIISIEGIVAFPFFIIIVLVLEIIKLDARGFFIKKIKRVNRFEPEIRIQIRFPSATLFNANRKNGDSAGEYAETLIFEKKMRLCSRAPSFFFVFKKKKKGVKLSYYAYVCFFLLCVFAISSDGKKS